MKDTGNVEVGSRDQGCFHCGLPADNQFDMIIEDRPRKFCCFGCQAITLAICDSGLSAFYAYREKTNKKVSDTVSIFTHYDNDQIQNDISHQCDDDHREIFLAISGISCAACAWLIEHRLQKISGISSASVNATNALCKVVWRPEQCRLSEIFSAISEVGYEPRPYRESQTQRQRSSTQQTMLMRLGVAAIGMMQVGMFAIALHAGALQGMEHDWQHFLRWVSLLVATPVVFFSARPFFINAVNSLKHTRLAMDVPVSIAIGLAYAASGWATLTNSGEVYFESISMFTFFLLLGRFLEMRVRHSSAFVAESFSQLLPHAVNRIVDESEHTKELVPISALQVGDLICVSPGDTIPCDGLIVDGEASVNESLLTGESAPQLKKTSMVVWAGSMVGEARLIIRADAVGDNTKLASVERLLQSAAAEKPRKVVIADRVASVFVFVVLVISALSAVLWLYLEPERALWVALSVLVVTCPCALSLATPAALTAGTISLKKIGILVTSATFIEKLVDVSRIIFDKTGTLTEGKLSIAQCVLVNKHGDDSQERVLDIVAALESGGNHPVAHAFHRIHSRYSASQIKVAPGQGVSGRVNGECYRFGKKPFAAPSSDIAYPGQGMWQLLSRELKPIAWVLLQDSARQDVASTMAALDQRGIAYEIMSGDREDTVASIAQRYAISNFRADALPEDKLQRIRQLQSRGENVLMVGDGINDVPSLGGANVSIAMGDSTRLARTHADAILLSGKLHAIPSALVFARRVQRTIKQNLYWALAYNVIALPAAVAGLVPPYLAALGMSLSSLIVVLNSLRLSRAVCEAEKPNCDVVNAMCAD